MTDMVSIPKSVFKQRNVMTRAMLFVVGMTGFALRPVAELLKKMPLPSATAGVLGCCAAAIWLPVGTSSDPSGTFANTSATTFDDAAYVANIVASAEVVTAAPLFHVTRQPPKVEVAAPPPPPPRATLQLAGVMGKGANQIALLRLSSSDGLYRMRVGERLDRWQIINISKTKIIVVDDTGERSQISIN